MTNSLPDYEKHDLEQRVKTMKVIVYKDGSWIVREHSWEYEHDPDFLVVIPVAECLEETPQMPEKKQ